MKRTSLMFMFAAFTSSTLISQNAEIPDTAFLNALIAVGVDTNGDSLISYAEAEATTNLIVVSRKISDITGIEAFINLYFLGCYNNNLSSLDVTKNIALTILVCQN